MKTLLVCPLHHLQNLAANISVGDVLECNIFGFVLTVAICGFFSCCVKVRNKISMRSTSSPTSKEVLLGFTGQGEESVG